MTNIHQVTNITARKLPNGEVISVGVSETVQMPALFKINICGLVVVFPKDDFYDLSNDMIDAICLHESGHIKANYSMTPKRIIISTLLMRLGVCDIDEITADLEVLRYMSIDVYHAMIQYIVDKLGKWTDSITQRRMPLYRRMLSNRFKRSVKIYRESL